MSGSKFTAHRQNVIIEALTENPSIYSAAAKAGVSYQAVMSWLQRGQEGVSGFAEFLQEVEEARSHMKDAIVRSLFKIATDEMHPQAVRAARELLTALYPREFSTVKHVITHHKSAEPEVDLASLPTGELREFRRMLHKVINPDAPQQPQQPVSVIEALEADNPIETKPAPDPSSN